MFFSAGFARQQPLHNELSGAIYFTSQGQTLWQRFPSPPQEHSGLQLLQNGSYCSVSHTLLETRPPPDVFQ